MWGVGEQQSHPPLSHVVREYLDLRVRAHGVLQIVDGLLCLGERQLVLSVELTAPRTQRLLQLRRMLRSQLSPAP